MATGTGRYLRYILFAFFGLAVLYFISSSSIPRTQFETANQIIQDQGSKWTHPQETEGTTVAVAEPAAVQESSTPNPPATLPPPKAEGARMNATFVTLARNSDVWEIAKSIRQVEDRFNRKFNYDWVFLNDKPFDAQFKKVTTALVSGTTRYGEIPKEHWSFPDFIDQEKAKKVREDMAERKIIYGDSVSYRHMCRYESGFFFQHPIMHEYEWYWRVEPSIELYCDINYDTFKYMADHKKKYSFVLSLYEYKETIPTLWDSVKKFMSDHPEHLAADNSMEFLSDDGGLTYNHCHFWSNFEIGNLDWLRSSAYVDYFNSLDLDGGFFYERWGDAPVHSVGAGLLLNKDEIHFFDDIAYYHVPFTHCPTSETMRMEHKCHCNPKENFDWKGYSCTTRFFDMMKMPKPEGYESQQE
ncbi:MAG: alpha 1,2-mannosyltransferase 2.4.1 [Thelocarpon superellum]|nr:MAG: alpha 1,2-mannosyltransferase 2.4.1 [Thelocarpon superellum]